MSKFTPSRTHIVKQAYIRGADLTLSSGAITVDNSHHRVNGEAGGADDLTTINGPAASDVGQILILSKKPGSGAVTVKDATGNINCAGDRVLGNDKDTIILMWQGSLWVEMAFADNQG